MIAASRDLARMQDYIVGRLSDDERRAFEDRLVRDPDLVRELEQSLRMREGLQQLRSQRYFAARASRGRSLRFWLPTLAAAAVAGLALVLPVQRERGTAPVLMSSLDSRGAVKIAPLIAAHFTFVSVRGSSTPDLSLPAVGLIEIRASPAVRSMGSKYRVSLSRRGQGGAPQPVGALGGLALSSDGYVRCFADASRLTQGSYLLSIAPDTRIAGVTESFPFNLRADATQPP